MKTQKPITGLIFPKDKCFSGVETSEMLGGFKSLAECENCSFFYIKHKPEKMELKEHCHFLLLPNSSKVDCKNIYHLLEHLQVMPVRPISFDNVGDFLLYSLHDSDYLRSKNLSRNFKYCLDDGRTNLDIEFLNYHINLAREQISSFRQLFEIVEKSANFCELLKSGKVNPLNLNLVKAIYQETHI